jgi:type I restriction enzyme, S subunit
MNKTRKSTMNSQLSDGYKQTEIGIIPEDWEVKRLKNISPSQSVGLVINPSSYFDSNGSVPMLVGSHINENGIDWESANRISNVSNNLLPSSRLAAGDLVTVRVGDPGLTAVVPSELDGCNCASMMIVRQHRSFDSCWLCYVMNSPFGRSQIEHVQYGTAQKQFNISDAIDFLYPVPLLNEQEAIAHALSDIDVLIESLDRLLTKKRQIKQGAMQELLTRKRRLRGFSGEWQSKTFGEIFNYQSTATNSRSDLIEDGDTYYIHYGDIHMKFHSHLDFNCNHPPKINRQLCENATLLQNGDWIMADASEDLDGVGKSVEIIGLDDSISVIAGLHTFVLREKTETFAPGFKGHLGNLKSLHDELLRVATGMKVFGISKTALKELTLPIPPLTEQIEIATILSDMDAEIDSIEAKLTKTRQIKQGMMHELLTGRIRLI